MEWLIGITLILLVLFLNGIIVEVEDDSPGGFNNPDGSWLEALRHPKKHQIVIWTTGLLAIGWLIYSAIS